MTKEDISVSCWYSVGSAEWRYLGKAVWLERWSALVFLLCKQHRVWILSELCRSLLFSLLLQESSGSQAPSVHPLVQLWRENWLNYPTVFLGSKVTVHLPNNKLFGECICPKFLCWIVFFQHAECIWVVHSKNLFFHLKRCFDLIFYTY